MFLILAPAVLSIDVHDVSYVIDNDIIKVQHNLTVNTLTDEPIKLLVPEDAYNFEVIVDKQPTSFTLSKLDEHKQVSIPLSRESHEIKINYLTSSFLENAKYSYFLGVIRTTHPTDVLTASLTLPETALLARPLNAFNPPISPSPFIIETTGRQITIKWAEENVEPKDIFSMFVVYDEDKSLFRYVLIGSIIILAFGLMFYFYNIHKKTKYAQDTSFSHLLESEQAIVHALLKTKNHTMWQKELQIAVKFTKSKLSRTINNMEMRHLVKKIPYGSTNKIELINENKNIDNKKKETDQN